MSEGIVRVGDTVRRPTGPWTPFVQDLLNRLSTTSFDRAPRAFGLDEQGREILTFMPGIVPPSFGDKSWTREQIRALARIVREYHDATIATGLAGTSEVVCHNDLSPCNFTFVDGIPSAIFDFDFAAPGSRVRDLVYIAWSWLLGAKIDDRLEPQLSMLRFLLDEYGLNDRAGFADSMRDRLVVNLQFHHDRQNLKYAEWTEGELEWLHRRRRELDAAIN